MQITERINPFLLDAHSKALSFRKARTLSRRGCPDPQGAGDPVKGAEGPQACPLTGHSPAVCPCASGAAGTYLMQITERINPFLLDAHSALSFRKARTLSRRGCLIRRARGTPSRGRRPAGVPLTGHSPAVCPCASGAAGYRLMQITERINPFLLDAHSALSFRKARTLSRRGCPDPQGAGTVKQGAEGPQACPLTGHSPAVCPCASGAAGTYLMQITERINPFLLDAHSKALSFRKARTLSRRGCP